MSSPEINYNTHEIMCFRINEHEEQLEKLKIYGRDVNVTLATLSAGLSEVNKQLDNFIMQSAKLNDSIITLENNLDIRISELENDLTTRRIKNNFISSILKNYWSVIFLVIMIITCLDSSKIASLFKLIA